MGRVPCWIVINCGGLSAAATTLAESDSQLADGARYLAGIEDEICELGGELDPLLDDAERAAVIDAGHDADALRGAIYNYMFAGQRHPAITTEQLTAFAEKQRTFFLALADKYKTAP
jgi:hypothetical protein